MNDEQRAELMRETRACERRLRELYDRVEELVSGIDRGRRRVFHAKVDVAVTELLDPLYIDYTTTVAGRDSRIRRMREQQDEMYMLSAELDRRRRDVYNEIEDLALQEQRQHAAQAAAGAGRRQGRATPPGRVARGRRAAPGLGADSPEPGGGRAAAPIGVDGDHRRAAPVQLDPVPGEPVPQPGVPRLPEGDGGSRARAGEREAGPRTQRRAK